MKFFFLNKGIYKDIYVFAELHTRQQNAGHHGEKPMEFEKHQIQQKKTEQNG